ncbi:MAG: helix-turn-helix domain-containing protein [Planctomycetota bacterium]
MPPTDPLSIRQLEVFVALVEQGSFTRAAQCLQLSQSTVSGHVADLEAASGPPRPVTRCCGPRGRSCRRSATPAWRWPSWRGSCAGRSSWAAPPFQPPICCRRSSRASTPPIPACRCGS